MHIATTTREKKKIEIEGENRILNEKIINVVLARKIKNKHNNLSIYLFI